MIQCMICLDNIKKSDQQIITHDKCKYIIHTKCNSKYNKCLYCHKEINNRDDQLIKLIDELINIYNPRPLVYELNISYLIYIIYVVLFIIFVICPAIIIYHVKKKLIND